MRYLHPILLCSLVLCAGSALAARLEIPLHLPFEPLRQALNARLAASPARPGTIYRDGPCRYLRLDAAKLEPVDGQLRLVGPGSAALGVEMSGKCYNASTWRGTMQFTLAPQLDRAGRLRFRIVDSQLTDPDGAETPALGFIWDLSKRYVHSRLQRFTYDIGPLRATLLAIMRSVAPAERAAELELALSRLQLLEPRVEGSRVIVSIALELPDAWLAAPPPSPAVPLSEAELEVLDEALQPWDAFLLYSIKQFALDSDDGGLRKRLFTLLLEGRYRLSAILSGEETAAGDPLRMLFIDAWNELRTVVLEAQRQGVLDASLLRYALFIDAGDALLSLDRAAPGLGMQVSADGLRQLARSLRPGAIGDPLAYTLSVDAELRGLFDVEEIPDSAPPPTRSWLEFFITTARAAGEVPPLDRWVPGQAELQAYETRVGGLLQKTAATELARGDLSAPYDKIYQNLVPTTALIESCWRQYVVRAGKVTYLRSAASSVGIMQVNQRVWRGFYDIERLRWSTAYNMRAGAQILKRYMKDYAIPYAERSGDLNQVPRAVYAVYNAGPRAVGRFNKAVRHPREERVDERLWTLYQAIAAGGEADLRSCGVRTSAGS
jgi:hypothetical protein